MSATLRARRIAMDETAPRLFAALVRLEHRRRAARCPTC